LTELVEKGGPVLDPQGNKTFQYQQSSARLYGLEVMARIFPSGWKGFSWNNNFALTYGINTSATMKIKERRIGMFHIFHPKVVNCCDAANCAKRPLFYGNEHGSRNGF